MKQPDQPLILVFVPHTLGIKSRSGIQKVTTSLVMHLACVADVELVTWDDVDGQMRFYDNVEMRLFFGSMPKLPSLRTNRHARAVGCRFQDFFTCEQDICMVLPEISYHMLDGIPITQRVITQCLEAGWRTAAILYDLIPISNKDYASMRLDHERYVAELLRCDLILPISNFVEQSFQNYLNETLHLSEQDLAKAGTKIATIVLPNAVNPPKLAASNPLSISKRTSILLLGTVERRKQQLQVIKAYKELFAAGRINLRLVIIGSLHPEIACAFEAIIDNEPSITYHGYLSNSEIDAAFRQARFSVFASCDEGFGLPITESLSQGVPCLTADFGAMGEVARDGGCLMVDVRQHQALKDGLLSLATDEALLTRLQKEIMCRPQRDWNNYVDELRGLLCQKLMADDLVERVRACLDAAAPLAVGALGPASPAIAFVDWNSPLRPDPDPSRLLVALVRSGRSMVSPERMLAADILILPSNLHLDDLVIQVHGEPALPAMPGWIDDSGNLECAVSLVVDAVIMRTRLALIAAREHHFVSAMQTLAQPFQPRLLSIVITTYNRALFAATNVAWILQQISELGRAVELVVVDNASKDESAVSLAPFASVPGVRIITNPTNVGMLGNLRICASLMLANHVWLIGDDDFIIPGALQQLIRCLSVNPGIPMVIMNFGVYHHPKMSRGDTPVNFIASRQILARNPVPTGPMRAIDAGSQHDNLFTAIYPIIFRSDLAAAVFNYFFRGKPFRSLTESIPTTQFILKNYALAPAMWVAEPCIVGNAHNSWQKYRVAWHAVLMPLALRLARRSGMDPLILRQWARIHVNLFEEASHLFPWPGLAAEFDDDALATSYQVLLQRLPLKHRQIMSNLDNIEAAPSL